MTHYLLNASDSLERQNEKLIQITEALMRQVEQDTDRSGAAYAQFERAALLEQEVRQRTRDLERVLTLLNDSNAQLSEATKAAETARANLANALETIREGFALFNPSDEMVMCNSRFGMHIPDLRERLEPGLTFAAYIAFVSTSPALCLQDGDTPRTWQARRLGRHRNEHSVFNVQLTGDRWIQVSEQRTANGGTVVMQTDITDIIRTEREERGKLLDAQARMIRATLDHINQGVCIFDAQRRLLGWNNKVGSLLSTSARFFRLGIDFGMLLERLDTSFAFRGGMTSRDLVDWAAQSGQRKPLSFEVRSDAGIYLSVFGQEMPNHGFVISFTDVTSERQAAAALAEANEFLEQRVRERTLELEDALAVAERANASKSRFVAAASHDLLQPLSAARLYASTLAETSADAGDRSIAAKALSAMRSVEQLIEQLLDISKLDAEHATADIQVFSLESILRPLASEFAPLAKLKGLDLRFVPTGAIVRSDPGYLRRIVQNLISNAVRYTDEGRVLVGARPSGGNMVLHVCDTGPGIAEEDQERIFTEFQRLHAKASASEGMGLGLAIVERACAFLGHPLGLDSEIGRGTVFKVSVPRVANAAYIGQTQADKQAERAPVDEAPVVLLVEPDEPLRMAMVEALESWGCAVLDAASSVEALEILDAVELVPDCVLVDQDAGERKRGVALAGRLREMCRAAHTGIMTADRSAGFREICAESGFAVLAKPLDPGQLEAFVSATRRNGRV